MKKLLFALVAFAWILITPALADPLIPHIDLNNIGEWIVEQNIKDPGHPGALYLICKNPDQQHPIQKINLVTFGGVFIAVVYFHDGKIYGWVPVEGGAWQGEIFDRKTATGCMRCHVKQLN